MRFDASGQTATVQLAFPMADLLANLQRALVDYAVEAGLLLARACLDDEVEKLVGPRYLHAPARAANRWGGEDGYVVFAGRKVPLRRPRVRDAAGREVALERYRLLQSERGLEEDVGRRVLCGVSARDYSKALDAFCDGYGVDKSSVSRHWRAASAARLRELLVRPLGDLNLAVVVVDGIRFGGFLFVVALGLDSGGRKHILGLWEGATENATVCKSVASTNGIESCFSVTRKGCRNVKRCRSAEMAWRWAGSVLMDVEARFRRVRGFRDLGHLLAALGRSLDESEKNA